MTVHPSTPPLVELPQDRRVPHAPDAEIAVLGAMLLDESAIGRAIESNLREEDFYTAVHRAIFRAILRLYDRRQAVDPVTLKEELRRGGDLERAGGEAYLAEVIASVPTVANVEYHARIVLENSIKRRLIAVGTQIVADAYERQAEEADTLLDQAEKRIFEIADRRLREGFVHINRLLHQTIELVESLGQSPNRVTGVPSDFKDLDTLTAGFQLSDLVIVAGRPSMGKCVAYDSEITLADGTVATIQEIVQRRQATLMTLGDDLKLRPADAAAFVDDGVKPVFRVVTRLGRAVETTLSHPFLTLEGWKRLAELRAGARIAVPRRLDVFGSERLLDCEVKLLAYLIGDGSPTSGSPSFTNANPRLRREFAAAARELGGLTVRRTSRRPDRAPSLRVSADRRQLAARRREFSHRLRRVIRTDERPARQIALAVGVSPASVTAWTAGRCVPAREVFERLSSELAVPEAHLAPRGFPAIRKNGGSRLALRLEALGLLGTGAREKRIPDVVFRLARPQLALFLNRLFATDGRATVLSTGQPQVGYRTVSERLARQVQHLLLRFGVVASLRRRLVRYRDGRRESWQIDITDARAIATFCEEIGMFGKEEALGRVRRVLEVRRRQTSRDLIPVEIRERIAASKGSGTWASLANRMGLPVKSSNLHAGTRALSRERLTRFAAALGEPAPARFAESDVYWDEIVSIEPAGNKQVYDLTVERTHNFMANDVCVHNTSFALNVAQNASIRHDVPVAVFSLEMSKEQLVQRILCSEARVDAQKMRTGHLSREEWQRIVRACDRLQNAKIYIDDTPALTILEMRAKARRLKSEVDLGLILVDYLQLMEVGAGPARADNRQQEISTISRSLKGLAKELNVPVVALSQLSRAPEQRSDHRPTLADLRECVTGDTLVMLADGRRVPIRDLVGTTPSVLAVAGNGRIVTAVSDRVWRVGRRPVFELRLASGRSVRATERHRLLTGDGWKRFGDMRTGERVAIARRIPEPAVCEEWLEERLVLLGHLIGDGSYLSNKPMRYTTSSEENSLAVVQSARNQFGSKVTRYPGRGRWHQLLISGNGNRWHPDGVNRWLRELGVFGQRSHEKRVPEPVFRLSNEQVALFLRHLWATDGSIQVRNQVDRSPRGTVYFSTCSTGLARDVSALLLRFGIVTRTRQTIKPGCRPVYSVYVEGLENQARFLTKIWAFGPKCEPAGRLSLVIEGARSNTNVDTLPRAVFAHVKGVMISQGISQRQMVKMRGMTHGGNVYFTFEPSRRLIGEYARILNDDWLHVMATNDLFWDRVIDVVPVSEEDVFDITVPGPSSWLADGIISHNSGALEQDSDLVLFLYREEVYNPKSEKDRGLAEVILGKHRNGPIGTVTLVFAREFTRFDNYTPRSEPF